MYFSILLLLRINLNKMYLLRSPKFLLQLLFSLLFFQLQAQEKEIVEIQFHLLDSYNNDLSDVSVQIFSPIKQDFNLTNAKGNTTFYLIKGTYEVQFFHIAYVSKKIKLEVISNQTIPIVLQQENSTLEEVVITATENKGLQTSSKINRKAMEHLQPSSFSDLMELLPGGKSATPNLTSNNRILIREFGQSGGQYNTSSLGVQFVMDGNVWNTNADMQTSLNESHYIGKNNVFMSSKRYTSDTGVDMRTLSTNDIDNVEIIRGIPTASFGDLTSGLVIINRKSGKTKWQGRIKTDGFSKMYYLSKGFEIDKTWDLNVSLDYLNAKSDPRDNYETYQRISSSIRSTKRINLSNQILTWRSFLDYNGTIDKNVFDPDTGYNKVDKYKNSRQRISFTNNFDYIFNESSLFHNIKLTSSLRQGFEDLDQTKFVQFSGPTVVSTATSTGVNEGYFPEISYISNFKTEGRPLDINAKLETRLDLKIGEFIQQIETGFDFKYSKNNGAGQIYDLLKPPTEKMTTRPRPFNTIPASQNIAFFLGNTMNHQIAEHRLNLYAGLRLSKVLGMDSDYDLSNRIFIEPRVNFQWNLPLFKIGKEYLKTDLTLGYGTLYKQPTLLMLYPNTSYLDYQQLNFYHPNESLRYVNFMTYAEDFTNKQLNAAKNTKKEIRIDLSYSKHEFFITYFDENMPNGFRSSARFNTYQYKRYSTEDIDFENLTEKPNIEDLPYETRKVLHKYTSNENGSSTHKKGIEFGYSSPRLESIDTRFTFSGAWFKTNYTNTDPYHEIPSKSIGGNGYPYVGIYKNDYGYSNSGLNYNLIVDTYLSDLDMNISASFQGTLFSTKSRVARIAEPYAYYGTDGIIHPFQEADKTDTYKQWLVRNVSLTDNMKEEFTFDINVNIKITKRIFKSLRASVFVNKLFSYYQPYYFNGVKVERREISEPYFGMELTYNF